VMSEAIEQVAEAVRTDRPLTRQPSSERWGAYSITATLDMKYSTSS
jgi:hypothetical protein